jgi:hypothetical protein
LGQSLVSFAVARQKLSGIVIRSGVMIPKPDLKGIDVSAPFHHFLQTMKGGNIQ